MKADAAAQSDVVEKQHPDTSTTATERTPASAMAAAESKGATSLAAADRPKESTTAKDAPRNAASAKSGKASSNGAYVVQVAALADAGKAKELEKRMAGAGVKTYTEVITTSTGEVTRVRAGPYATKDAAEKARVQLKKAGLEGKIVPK